MSTPRPTSYHTVAAIKTGSIRVRPVKILDALRSRIVKKAENAHKKFYPSLHTQFMKSDEKLAG